MKKDYLDVNKRKLLKYVGFLPLTFFLFPHLATGDKKPEIEIDGGWQIKPENNKHVPIVTTTRSKDLLKILVTVEHPQTSEHHISAIKIYNEKRIELSAQRLHPNLSIPTAFFILSIPAGKSLFAITDCNLHGLWAKQFLA